MTKAYANILSGILLEEADKAMLARWVIENEGIFNALDSAMIVVERCKQLFRQDDALAFLLQMRRVVSALTDCQLLLTTPEPPLTICMRLQQAIHQHFRMFPCRHDSMPGDAMLNIFLSPLFNNETGDVPIKLAACLASEGGKAISPVRHAMEAALTHTGMAPFSVRAASAESLSALVSATIPDDVTNEALAWAKNVGDKPLLQQVYFFDHAISFMRDLAQAELLHRRCASKSKMSERCISEEQVEIWNVLRTKQDALRSFLEAHWQAVLFPTADPYHLRTLHGVFSDVQAFGAQANAEMERLASAFREMWVRDLRSLTSEIQQACPVWEPFREQLCTNPKVCEQLCNNPKYGSIGVLAGELKKQVKFVKVLNRQGVMVPPDVVTEAASAADHGVETVGFTYFVFRVIRGFPKQLTTQAAAAAAVEQLKKELKPSKLVLTDEMNELLNKWESGAMLAINAASADSGSGAAGSESPAASPVAAQPERLSSPAASSAPVMSELADSDVSTPAAKRSLADRMRDAKRTRIT